MKNIFVLKELNRDRKVSKGECVKIKCCFNYNYYTMNYCSILIYFNIFYDIL